MGVGTVDAVLLDSGGVLIGPVGGRWNPRFDFEAIVRRWSGDVSDGLLATAIGHGDAFLAAASGTPSRDSYHRAMLEVLDIDPSPGLLAELDAPLEPASVVEPFAEVVEVLDELKARGLRLAVVSDAWPTLPELHAGVGLAGYFDAYAISSLVGCTKPDPRMYRHASDALGLLPARCLFVDDSPPLVEAALDLGYQGVAVLRDGSRHDRVRSITDLRELLPLI
ncbi:MAG: HAD family phosphatase [Acidimicrobiales bacterium]